MSNDQRRALPVALLGLSLESVFVYASMACSTLKLLFTYE